MASQGLFSRTESNRKSKSMLPDKPSVGRLWKFRRNLVIFIANRNGVSQRLLADVFDLPHSRIDAIIKEFRSKHAE
jgi:hypothetical protein